MGSGSSQWFSVGDLVEGLGDVVDVVGVEAGNRDSSVSGHVDGVLFLELLDLLGAETSISKHTDLGGEVTPVVSAAVILQFLDHARPHLLDSTRHVQQVLVPAGSQGWVAQNDINDTSSVNGRVRVHRSGNSLNS